MVYNILKTVVCFLFADDVPLKNIVLWQFVYTMTLISSRGMFYS